MLDAIVQMKKNWIGHMMRRREHANGGFGRKNGGEENEGSKENGNAGGTLIKNHMVGSSDEEKDRGLRKIEELDATDLPTGRALKRERYKYIKIIKLHDSAIPVLKFKSMLKTHLYLSLSTVIEKAFVPELASRVLRRNIRFSFLLIL